MPMTNLETGPNLTCRLWVEAEVPAKHGHGAPLQHHLGPFFCLQQCQPLHHPAATVWTLSSCETSVFLNSKTLQICATLSCPPQVGGRLRNVQIDSCLICQSRGVSPSRNGWRVSIKYIAALIHRRSYEILTRMGYKAVFRGDRDSAPKPKLFKIILNHPVSQISLMSLAPVNGEDCCDSERKLFRRRM